MLYTIGLLLGTLFVVVIYKTEILFDKKKTEKKEPEERVSRYGKRVIEAYRALPTAAQNAGDIVVVVKMLDAKYPGIDGHAGGWHCITMDKYHCSFKEYHQLLRSIETAKKAYEEQERVLKVANLGGSEMASILIENLRKEAKLVNQVTSQFTE